MRIARADRLRRTALQQLRDLAGQVAFYGMLHSELMDREKPILDSVKTCPASVKAYLSGYRQCIIERWYETELAYCHRAPCGTLYSAHKAAIAAGIAKDVDAIYKANRGQEIGTWQSAHYWIAASVREAQHGRPAKPY